MKISQILLTAMASRDIKNATELSKLTGVKYGTVARAINNENVGIKVVVELLDFMGYQLKAEIAKPEFKATKGALLSAVAAANSASGDGDFIGVDNDR